MLIIADHRLPARAKTRLSEFGELILFKTDGVAYEAISGHPDIFFCKTVSGLVVAPNLPKHYVYLLNSRDVDFKTGYLEVEYEYPGSARYNAVATQEFLIHKQEVTDRAIIENCNNLITIQVKQGYTRCSLLPLGSKHFITSDVGIYNSLIKKNLNVLYVDPQQVMLPGMPHGFFGGACGIMGKQVFFAGSLNYFIDGQKVRDFIAKAGMEVVELYNGPLFDGGGILFL